MKGQFSAAHIDAINRRRRVIVNFDVISADGARFATKEIERLVEWKFMFADESGAHIDSIHWSWGEGHQAPYPSEVLPLYDSPGFKKWADDGINIVQVFLEAAKQRGIESFFSYRINGSDNDLGPVAEIPMKEEHPDWLISHMERQRLLELRPRRRSRIQVEHPPRGGGELRLRRYRTRLCEGLPRSATGTSVGVPR